MARRWFPRLSVDEKAIKFGLTRPTADAAIYYAPRPSRYADYMLPRGVHRDAPVRLPRRHLLARPNQPRRIAQDGVSVELLHAVRVGRMVSYAAQFDHSVERYAASPLERLLVRSEVRRVRIDEGIVAYEMTRISVRDRGSRVTRVIALYFGVVSSDGESLQMARITAADESTLRRQRGAVAAFLRRWVTVHDIGSRNCALATQK